MFGRKPNLDHLFARSKQTGLTAIVGRPKMGKTWLLQEFARLAPSHGYLVRYLLSPIRRVKHESVIMRSFRLVLPRILVIGFVSLAGAGLPLFGETWVQTSAPITNWNSLSCSADGSRIAATTSGGATYVSTNFLRPSQRQI